MATTLTAPALGQVGKYRLRKELGASHVYEAEDTESGRTVAVKLVSRHASFGAEAEPLTRLRHEHIVPILDADEANGRCYLAMELLQGESLRDRLKREHSIPWQEAARLAREAASGLAAIHALGLVHRDVCPSSLWLEPSGRLRLLGIGGDATGDDVALLDRLGGARLRGCLSPEQAAGEPVTAASDLFGLGCVLYQMATGEPPFRGDNSAALVRAIVFEAPKSARAINPDIPAALAELIGRLLAKLPAGRPASAREVEERLAEWAQPASRFAPLATTPPLVYPASKRILETINSTRSMPEPSPAASTPKGIVIISPEPPPRKRRWLADVVAAAILLAAATGLYFWWKASNGPGPTPPAVQESK